METKEQKAKEYAESIAQFEDRKRYCEEDFKAGWDAALKNQWISTRERLPELMQRVLVVSRMVTRMGTCIMKRIPHDTSDPNNGKWHWSIENNKENVIAWMPIPTFDLKDNKDVLK